MTLSMGRNEPVDADRPARNGFNSSCFTGNVDPVYCQASCALFTIPAGREAVIETWR